VRSPALAALAAVAVAVSAGCAGSRAVLDEAPPGGAEVGVASFYADRLHGRPTASGEPYDMYAMTAAHRTLPLPSFARVSNPANGRSAIVRVNDRGPFVAGRVIDLSYAAALKLGVSGLTTVEVVRITPEEIRSGTWLPAVVPPAMPPPAACRCGDSAPPPSPDMTPRSLATASTATGRSPTS